MKVKLSTKASEELDLARWCLSKESIYPVIGISDDSYRIINDQDEPVLYPKEYFEVVDELIPPHWVRTDFEDGEYYIDPPEFSGVGFFEDYFDGIQSVVKKYHRYLKLNRLEKHSR